MLIDQSNTSKPLSIKEILIWTATLWLTMFVIAMSIVTIINARRIISLEETLSQLHSEHITKGQNK